MTISVLIHSIFMIIAFFTSFFIFWKKKGTKNHKILGWIFVGSMAIGSLSSFFIKGGKFSYIHILSTLTLYWLIKGVRATRLKQKNWKMQHLSAMGSAYIGLISAGIGVAVRYATVPVNYINGYIATALTVAIAVPFFIKQLQKLSR